MTPRTRPWKRRTVADPPQPARVDPRFRDHRFPISGVLRREECCKDALIVAVSGYGQDEDRRRSKDAGFDYHLIKPLDHNALLALLAEGNGRR
jgi:hypothetical protein